MTDFIAKLSKLYADNVNWRSITGTVEDLVDGGYDITIGVSDIITKGPWVDVRAFGAVGDGVTDDTAAIQVALDSIPSGGTVLFPAGYTFMINAEVGNLWFGLKPLANTTLIIQAGATLKAISNSSIKSTVININGVDNVSVMGGGTIIGERTGHTGTTGEWGYGINVSDSNYVHISDLTIHGCWGDGIFVGGLDTNPWSNHCTIERVHIYDCRRQGISVTGANHLIIRNCKIHDIDGTSPMAGIDIEQNGTDTYCDSITIEDNEFYNVKIGIDCHMTTGASFRNNRITTLDTGVYFTGISAGTETATDKYAVDISNNYIIQPTGSSSSSETWTGIWFRSKGGMNLNLNNNYISMQKKSNITYPSAGVYVGISVPDASAGAVSITNNYITGAQRGVHVIVEDQIVLIENNHIADFTVNGVSVLGGDAKISNNKFVDATLETTSTQSVPIRAYTNTVDSKLHIVGNSFHGITLADTASHIYFRAGTGNYKNVVVENMGEIRIMTPATTSMDSVVIRNCDLLVGILSSATAVLDVLGKNVLFDSCRLTYSGFLGSPVSGLVFTHSLPAGITGRLHVTLSKCEVIGAQISFGYATAQDGSLLLEVVDTNFRADASSNLPRVYVDCNLNQGLQVRMAGCVWEDHHLSSLLQIDKDVPKKVWLSNNIISCSGDPTYVVVTTDVDILETISRKDTIHGVGGVYTDFFKYGGSNYSDDDSVEW